MRPQHLLPQILQPGVDGGIGPQFVLVIAQAHGQEGAAPELQQPAVQLLGHEVELGVRRVPETQHSKVHLTEGGGWQAPPEDEPPEILHVVRGVSLACSCTNKYHQGLINQIHHGVGVQGFHPAAELPASGLAAQPLRHILGCARLAAEEHQEPCARHGLTPGNPALLS